MLSGPASTAARAENATSCKESSGCGSGSEPLRAQPTFARPLQFSRILHHGRRRFRSGSGSFSTEWPRQSSLSAIASDILPLISMSVAVDFRPIVAGERVFLFMHSIFSTLKNHQNKTQEDGAKTSATDIPRSRSSKSQSVLSDTRTDRVFQGAWLAALRAWLGYGSTYRPSSIGSLDLAVHIESDPNRRHNVGTTLIYNTTPSIDWGTGRTPDKFKAPLYFSETIT